MKQVCKRQTDEAKSRRPDRSVRVRRGVMRGLAACGVAAALVSCAGDEQESIQVFAAASLTATFTELGELFEEEHGVAVEFNFAGSSDLVAQIEEGAPADVFASADEANMNRAVEADLVASEPEVFATNSLIIATPPDNPAGIESLADLARDDVVTVICAPQVPCGAATEQVTAAAGVELSPASEEAAVTDVLGKVAAGEADAGLVYVTDVIGAGDSVQGIEFDEATEVLNRYPIVVLSAGQGSDNAEASDEAQAFVDFVNAPQGREVLSEAGFGGP